MPSLPESLKSFANRMARSAYSGDAAQIVRLLRVSGLFGGPTAAPGNTGSALTVADLDDAFGGMPAGNYGDNVGIWAPKSVNGKVAFVRRVEMIAEWTYWADVPRIEPKSEKVRVLLMGESVARGHLYDPVFNPAMALQTMLEAQFGADKVEVIDLARTNLGFQILDVAINALQMEPDIAVVFAGNNWYISEPLPSELAEIDEAIAKHGIAGAKPAIDSQLARTSRRIVNELCTSYEDKGVPLIWMIPEFNLRDWHDPITNAPYLPGDANTRWLALLDEAQSALHDRDFASAAVLAQELVEIDRGLCVAPYYILAECSREAKDVEAERNYLTLARDATSWDLSKTTVPRAYSVMQDAVREETRRHDVQVIDLPALFKEYLKGGVPDRRLFLDYCHLTTEGIQIAMSAAASCILQALKGVDRPWYAFIDEKVAPSPETEAEASFLAAITNARCSQPLEIVQHLCRRALSYSRHVGSWMLDYVELQTRSSAPVRMSETEAKMWREGSPLMRNLLRLNKKRLDRLLLNVIVDELERVGLKARERVERLWVQEHSVTRDATDLLDYYYCAGANQERELMWLNSADPRYRPEAEYYRAYWPESKFIFVGEAGCAVHLCLTCRLPKAEREALVRLRLNSKPQAEMTAGSGWTTWDLHLPGDAVRNGLNEIAISWPIPQFDTDGALEKARLRLIERKFPDFFPIFGEIHSFTASDGCHALPDMPVVRAESSRAGVARLDTSA